MKTATTADLRNHFRRVSSWLDNGESVEIIKRGKPYATLLPIVKKAEEKTRPKVDFRAQCHEIWRGRKFTAAEVEDMRNAELEAQD
jgi:antitoxin (DNA-binding transcriptional repressor) of toxin-antitoxin stability system